MRMGAKNHVCERGIYVQAGGDRHLDGKSERRAAAVSDPWAGTHAGGG